MSADVVLWSNMSRVESPFHAIAAQALDDDPSPVESEANAAVVAVAAPGTTISEGGLEADGVKTPTSPLENGVHEVEQNKEEAEEDNVGEETSVVAGGARQAKGSSAATPEGGNEGTGDVVAKKSKKRTNVWTKTTSRKSTKKNGSKNGGARPSDAKDDNVILKPFHQEDDPGYPTLLSKIHKAEKIELSLDRLTASGSKGYRMVRATRGVVEGAWYFEIIVQNLGLTGHTRLGWSSRRGDIQAPVGYDAHSYAYRDVDGSKVHCALREPYGEPYVEGDCIGFYINLPREANYTRKAEEEVVGWKGQPYFVVADEPLKPVSGSEILYFRNGVSQGVAFTDINDGTYYPAASMYTLPNQDVCRVSFNFGPEFRYPPVDLGGRPIPSPMSKVSGPPTEASKAAADGPSKPPIAVYGEPFETPGVKQRMVPDHTTAVGAEEQQLPVVAKKEKVPKRFVRTAPPLAKKKKPQKSVPTTNSKNGVAPKPSSGMPSASKKSKAANGLPPSNPDSKPEASRTKSSKVDSAGAVVNLNSHARRPWTLENRLEGAHNVDVEVVVEASAAL
ncbi:Set1/Ash2 histone methyltransferase complex subunit ASH2 [Marchantia polymorpha subsp. ruderalis]|uniref:B30.2/SPRY domain-containing protein n=2 Tax=Marchantia polymorpha TaxID=3197 RepID=A0A176VX76_MARPO|nr:hypothetical protein AXG93_48s1020 [Marchantia polymorpha subsp. ruderalis]PTQ41113.1 hypothetical protein MARPO_0036s0095 [Marchantia polymorpha]BBM97810.1 hypothetical protein Mp_1g08520 [Marchantia polymorpha subsp. ruderalis]|eukprot:PTQ41113.1 hypothetical protein MARPO_0036s0095 [Marchantia polymorpha]